MSAAEQTLILSIDQGATKTQALLADGRGHLLATGMSAGACWPTSGMAYAMQAVLDAVREAENHAGADLSRVGRVTAGMTGIDWPGDKETMRQALAGTLRMEAERINAMNDCVMALRAGTSSAAGAILCAGTGLNCAVRNEAGEELVFGYYIHDDCQGGSALGRRTVQAAIDMEIGLRPRTPLFQTVLSAMNCASADQLLKNWVENRLKQRAVCELPRAVDTAACAGDVAAMELLYRFGWDMAGYASAGLRRLGMSLQRAEVVLSGSVFKCQSSALVDGVRERLRKGAPLAVLHQSRLEPVVGGILLALDAMKRSVPDTLEKDAEGLCLIRMK